ncbi:MAG: hypothetical protein V1776_01335 [Candidatus Diapherotrites archaeon]
MRTIILLAGLTFFLFSIHAYAQESTIAPLLDTVFLENGNLNPALSEEIALATSEFKKLPLPVQSLFGNQRIHVELKLMGGSIEKLGIITVDNTIQSLTRYPPTDPTLKVWTDEETIHTIANSEDQAGAFVQAVNQGKLKYQGVDSSATLTTLIADIMVFLTNLVNAIKSVLGLY